MKVIDLMIKEADIRSRIRKGYRLAGWGCASEDGKKVEQEVRRNYEYLTKMADEYDEIQNRLNEALASTYMTVDGARLSLATAMQYMKAKAKPQGMQFAPAFARGIEEEEDIPFEACGEEGTGEKIPRLVMLYALDHALEEVEMLTCGNQQAINPLNLTNEVGKNRRKDFMVKVKSEFYRLAANTEA